MKRSKTNAGLVAKAQEIDDLPFPFEQLPTDLIYKIFMDSGFTIRELHTLCNLSKNLKAICNDLKVWEKILFKHVLGYGKEMREAERKGTLLVLMSQIRETEAKILSAWYLIRHYEPFVVVTAMKLWKQLIKQNELLFLHDKDVDKNFLVIKLHNGGLIRVEIAAYEKNSKSKNDYREAIFQAQVMLQQTFSQVTEERNWVNGKLFIREYLQTSQTVDPKLCILYICFLLSRKWTTNIKFDNKPLASCVTCGNASFDQLGKCSCPCEQIFCSVQCQRKLH